MSDALPTPEPPATEPVVDDVWQSLRAFTSARIGLGRAGVSQPTRHHLNFQLAHAQARDAVQRDLDSASLLRDLNAHGHDALLLRSAAGNRQTYLQRPDLGRRLDPQSAKDLAQRRIGTSLGYDAAFVIADGLSALAVQRHALLLLDTVLPQLGRQDWQLAPLVVVEQGRVAISDEIGAALGATLAIILIGERPGLSSPDSLGIYLTYRPQPGNTDAQRNCISNIRAAGLSYAEAAGTLLYLMRESRRRQISGIDLKADSGQIAAPTSEARGPGRNFLVLDGGSP